MKPQLRVSPPPKVSIALAVYNGERFLREQLESIARQTRLPDELIISDDASTDGTAQIIHQFANRAPFQVTLLLNEENVGCTRNFDRAIRHCKGETIFLCDHDDLWYPNKIETTLEALEANPKAGVATCDADLIDEHSRKPGQTFWQHKGFNPQSIKRPLSQGMLYTRSLPVYGPGIAFRRKLLPLFLPLPDDPPFQFGGQDYFIMWCVLAAGAGGLALIETPLLGYRQHSNQITARLATDRYPRWRARTERPLTVLRPLIERLESDAADKLCINRKMREAALLHWRSRCFLPASKIRRIPVVTREFISGRYNEFSDGFKTALKDLIFVR